MAAITICSDFGAQKHVSTVSPSICHEVVGPALTAGLREGKDLAEATPPGNYYGPQGRCDVSFLSDPVLSLQ